MERIKMKVAVCAAIMLLHTLGLQAQDNTLVHYWYAIKVNEGKVAKDSCLYKVDYFTDQGLPLKSECYGPCNPNPLHVSYMMSDSLLLGEIIDNGATSSAFRYLYIEGVLAKKIANNHYPGLPNMISLVYDEQGRIKEENMTDAVGKPFESRASIKYSYTKSGIHRVTSNAAGDVLLIEDIVHDEMGHEKSVSMRLPGSKHPFMLLKRY